MRIFIICLLFLGAIQAASAATLVVAARDSSALEKSTASYICDGIDDQVEIQNALNAAGVGGTVRLAAGTYNVDGTITIPGGRTLTGQGTSSVLNVKGLSTWKTWYGNSPCNNYIKIVADNVRVSNLKVTNQGWFYISANHIYFTDVVVEDSGMTVQSGLSRIGMDAAFYLDAPTYSISDIRFTRCSARNVGTNGWRAGSNLDPANYDKTHPHYGVPSYTISNVIVTDCEALRCGAGIYPDYTQGYRDKEIYACGFDWTEFVYMRGLVMENCRAIDCWDVGIYFEPRGSAYTYDQIIVRNCVATDTGQRKLAHDKVLHAHSANFIIGRGVTYENCYSENGARAGFLGIQAFNSKLIKCVDVGSTNGFYITGAGHQYSNIQMQDCVSRNAKRYGFSASLMKSMTIRNLVVENAKGDGTYLNAIGKDIYWGFTGPVDYSSFQIRATAGGSSKIMNQVGTGNTFDCAFVSNTSSPLPTPTLTPLPTLTPAPTLTPQPTPTLTPAPTPTPGPTPTSGAYMQVTLPARIEAENYDYGGEGVAYHDTSAANAYGVYRTDDVDLYEYSNEPTPVVAGVRPGEWLKYTVTVPVAGTYDVDFRVASNHEGTFKLQVDGADATGNLPIPATGGWSKFTTVTSQVNLPAGTHVLTLVLDGAVNVNYMEFTVPGSTPIPEPTPTSGAYMQVTLPARIEAENYDYGGEGVAYHDTSAGNTYGVYREDDVDLFEYSDEPTPVVAGVRPGEWLKYTVTVPVAGTYDVDFRVASNHEGTFKLQVDGTDATGNLPIPATGGWSKFTTVTSQVNLPAGTHVLTLVLDGAVNVNYMEFTAR